MSDKVQILLLHKKKIIQLQKFLKKYWNEKHIFVKNKKFLIWQHQNQNLITHAAAFYKRKIVGIQGYISQSHYDSKINKNQIFLTIFRVIENVLPGLGLNIFKFIEKKTSAEFIGTLGFTPKLKNYHEWLGYKVGYLNHHIAISKNTKKFKILINKNKKFFAKKKNDKYSHFLIDKNFLLKNKLTHLFKYQYPEKTSVFLINRYLKHPIFKYKVYLIKKLKKPKAILVVRDVFFKNSKATKIIDFIGKEKEFSNIGNVVNDLLCEKNNEFVDIYSFGINLRYIKNAGFINRYKTKGLIAPEYFAPFIRKNIDLLYGYKCKKRYIKKVRLFRGDGDRDRPNFI
jgi:hypothetical protein